MIKREFDVIGKTDTNRVLKQQLKLVHKRSRIECWLLFESDLSPINPAKVISDLFTLMPICTYAVILSIFEMISQGLFVPIFHGLKFHFPGRQLIAYVRAWQTVINGIPARNGKVAFLFNTYTIATLVIFFLQMNYKMPTVADAAILAANIKPSTVISPDDQKLFDKMLSDFFHFYGSRYEINNHLISARIGRWQEQRLTGQQKHFTPEQKR